MMNLKFYIVIALIFLILLSTSLSGYINYAIATASDYKFKSDDITKPNEYVVLEDVKSRGTSAPAFWSSNKYFFIAPHMFNLMAMALGGYLLYVN